ncbi:DNA mismatch repair endonuclease MutL [Peptoclostridium sp. AF21-18]|uniref:DNA mismatch repair endonuclease MutL n=1 Tax=Peptoclostridium sp. AF21-18 TaxID=2292243 RepID=UPI000E4894F2|nr:DNA mismatch repair endonuclease MutL [Peptoclostridium sp. AF21-18]RHQ98567.1 DNA mismatch repair endonuclease MutL [Peptoclostridium sp. AF21-18]
MKNRINLLDEITINKIAAGEVVERPSSIVKELVENSIDAGADRIIIEVENGGKSLIKITDNGCGIPSSEVKKCFLRHATSKIDKIDDLFNLFTLGFRGEALASICAVSKLEMTTKFEDEAVGTKITLVGGNIEAKEAVGANTGTSIVIKDLFFNTPARKKFLKTDHAELMNITDIVNKLAIGYPNVKFRYLNAGKLMVNTPGDGKLVSAVRSIYSREVSENLIEINYDCSLFKIDGYIGNNNIYRSNRNLQHVYINGRFVKSKIIYDAIANAYKSIIPINKHAVCFINLHLDPQKVDVNIHPGKIEVKFEKENEIKLEIMEYIRAKLLKQSLIGKFETFDRVPKDRAVKQDFSGNAFKNQDFGNTTTNFSETSTKFGDKNIKPIDLSDEVDVNSFIKLDDFEEKKKKEVKNKSNATKNTSLKNYDNKTNKRESYSSGFSSYNSDVDNYKNSYSSAVKIEDNDKISETESQMVFTTEGEILDSEKKDEIEKKEAGFSLKYYKVVGVVFDTYIVLQKGESMYLMDQHAAHERVLFERYMNAFHKREVHMQMLLDPIVLELSSVDMLQVEKNLDIFRNFGFEVEIFGMNNILIRGVPNLFGTPQSEKFILELIDNIDKISNNYDLKDDRFAIMACKSAIKANDRIQNIEIESLFKQLEKCENPYTCPHGRPTMVEISKVEIEKMFKRIM